MNAAAAPSYPPHREPIAFQLAMEAERRRRRKAKREARPSPWVPHVPEAKQQRFLNLGCDEALYGGAAGGGKSSALLMAALQYVEQPRYAALLLRRTYADLAKPGALMDRAAEWLRPTAARWNEREKTWTFPSGAKLVFGYLEHENDKYQYGGSEVQFCAFDELTQFTRTQYLFLFSRLRRLVTSSVPVRMRAATNPGGVGHAWVKERFEIPDHIGPDDEERCAARAERAFVFARLEDMPHVDQVQYDRAMLQLDPVTRAQLRFGDWSAKAAGQKFKREWFEIVTTVPAQMRRLRFWDLAATPVAPDGSNDPDWAAGVRCGWRDGVLYVEHVRRTRTTPQGVQQMVRQQSDLDRAELNGRSGAYQVWLEQEPGAAGVHTIDHYRRYVLAGFDFRAFKTSGDKLSYANPLSAAAEAGNVKLLSGAWNSEFLDELEAFTGDGRGHDDMVDAASKAHHVLSMTGASLPARRLAL